MYKFIEKYNFWEHVTIGMSLGMIAGSVISIIYVVIFKL